MGMRRLRSGVSILVLMEGASEQFWVIQILALMSLVSILVLMEGASEPSREIFNVRI